MQFYCSTCVALVIMQMFAINSVSQVRGQQPLRDETAIKQFSDGDAHDDPALKCYMNCLFHEVEVVDDNGEVHYDKLKAFLPDDVRDYVFQLILDCESHTPVGLTQCDRAWSWHRCWKAMDSKHYFLL